MRMKFDILLDQLRSDPEREDALKVDCERARGEAREFENLLFRLQSARDRTQTDLAVRLGLSANEISEMERQADLHLSTLLDSLDGSGVRLDLTAAGNGRQTPLSVEDLVVSTEAGAPTGSCRGREPSPPDQDRHGQRQDRRFSGSLVAA